MIYDLTLAHDCLVVQHAQAAKACQGKGHRMCGQETGLDVCRTCLGSGQEVWGRDPPVTVYSIGPKLESNGCFGEAVYFLHTLIRRRISRTTCNYDGARAGILANQSAVVI